MRIQQGLLDFFCPLFLGRTGDAPGDAVQRLYREDDIHKKKETQ